MQRTDTLFSLPLPYKKRREVRYARLYGSADALVLAQLARQHERPLVVVTEDMAAARRLEEGLRFYLGGQNAPPLLAFPDWETLPYDVFSPYQDIVSQRLETLHRLPGLERGLLVLPVATLMQRLAPRHYLEGRVFSLAVGERLDPVAFRERLVASGYRHVPQVNEHGEFAVRGALIDLYPMGAELPFRIDLFDDEIESIRTFDPESQLTVDQTDAIRLLPGQEFPVDEAGIARFRQAFRARFEGDPQRSLIYREVSQGLLPGGIEYYLPLFFERTETLFDYLPQGTLLVTVEDWRGAAETFWRDVEQRYEQRRHDVERPLLAPDELYLRPEDITATLEGRRRIHLQRAESPDADAVNLPTAAPSRIHLDIHAEEPLAPLTAHLEKRAGRTLLVADGPGRRQALQEMLTPHGLRPRVVKTWDEFLAADEALAITDAPLDEGLRLEAPDLEVITEGQLFGQRARQDRRRRRAARDAEGLIRDLSDLAEGAPVVHVDHGVGRYRGLKRLEVGGHEGEFLTLEYADGDTLYVPVTSLHLISRYTGASPENAPLHKLGSGQWEKAKRKAAQKAHDVAAELLDIYARREAARGRRFRLDPVAYAAFTSAFPFEETPDQQAAIDAVIADLCSDKVMDRVVCGDVGFGKTEVAMRAAFVATHGGAQVAVLVPTTLLAQQHYQNFRDRFADTPVRIEVLSRFRSKKEQARVLEAVAEGRVDILIGTHKLLAPEVRFKDLGLVIIDEEQRFGVRHKEKLKKLRAQVDVLTLTATPIPRTLNLAMSGLRDLSIIATPPTHRHAVKTFVSQWDKAMIREACLRELRRGGQVYFLHNEVESIERVARELGELLPEGRIGVAHGQMRERELEQIMLDFYHGRINVLVCTTIIESGIDIPNANTILINRADKLGLAQLHQLRGRVGRSHHRAYAYLITPPKRAMTADAVKRLEAIESLDQLGAGFLLATHDLEIRGAGELLGDEQSGQIQEVGFGLYTELLKQAVKALKSGQTPDLEAPLESGPEIEVHSPALIPDDYLPDVHTRLMLYKRIASAEDEAALQRLEVEMVDRFGLLPEPVKTLFAVARLKQRATALGIKKIDYGPRGGRILFGPHPQVDPAAVIQLIQTRPQEIRLDGQDKLRLLQGEEDLQKRLEVLEELLDTLAPREVAAA